MKNGFEVVAVCTSGAQVLSQMEDLNGGIVVCGYRLTDMLYSELRECMSAENAMLMIASQISGLRTHHRCGGACHAIKGT